MQNRTVAIIDDNQDSLKELEIILTMAGYTTILVNDILAAVDTVINNKPDVRLPMRLTGFLVRRKFRSSRCQIYLKMNLNG